MRTHESSLFIVIPVVYFIVVIAIAHFFVPEYYRIRVNTISEMAAQGLSNAWIMRLGFMGFGILLSAGLVILGMRNKGSWMVIAPFMLYAVSIFMTGIWSTHFEGANLPYDLTASKLHSLFASIAGFSLILTILVTLFKQPIRVQSFFHIVFAVLIIALSVMIFAIPSLQGIIQRLMYLVSFTWMVFFFNRADPARSRYHSML